MPQSLVISLMVILSSGYVKSSFSSEASMALFVICDIKPPLYHTQRPEDKASGQMYLSFL